METGSRNHVCHVIKQNDIIIVLKSALNPNDKEIGQLLEQHGDHVKDIAFSVVDLDAIVERACQNGAKLVKPISFEADADPQLGHVRMATVQTYGDVTHTLIERHNYKGKFLPGFKSHPNANDPLKNLL